jgi:hypothetical protein
MSTPTSLLVRGRDARADLTAPLALAAGRHHTGETILRAWFDGKAEHTIRSYKHDLEDFAQFFSRALGVSPKPVAHDRAASRRIASVSGSSGVSTPIGNRRQFDRLPGGGYVYRLVDDAVSIELRYLRHKDGQQHAEIDVRLEWASISTQNGSLSCADLNLSSQAARKGLATYCAERSKTKPADFDWNGVINAACLETIQAERQGERIIVLDDAPDIAERDLEIVPGFEIPGDASSLLIAHGDSLKSLILLFALGTLAGRGLNVLLVDWEWTGDRHRARKQRLFGPGRLDGLQYLRCHAPLVHEADRIRRYCDVNAITFVGVDSIGLACDGKLVDDDVAIRFHRALSTLPPSLCAVQLFCQEFSVVVEAARHDAKVVAGESSRERAKLDQQIGHLVQALKDGVPASVVKAELRALETRRATLDATRIATPPAIPPLPVDLSTRWERQILDLREALAEGAQEAQDAKQAIRGMVDEIRLTPRNGALSIDVKGNLPRVLNLVSEETYWPLQSTLVAGAGFEPATFGL